MHQWWCFCFFFFEEEENGVDVCRLNVVLPVYAYYIVDISILRFGRTKISKSRLFIISYTMYSNYGIGYDRSMLYVTVMCVCEEKRFCENDGRKKSVWKIVTRDGGFFTETFSTRRPFLLVNVFHVLRNDFETESFLIFLHFA